MSFKTKKNSQKQEAEAGLKSHSPVCSWGIFHNLQQNRWHKVVKSLPRARLGSGKHDAGQEKGKATCSNSAEAVRDSSDDIVDKCTAEAKQSEPPAHKNSMKSRIKALITEEVCRKKVRHRRSTSYPSRKPSDENIPVPSHQKVQSVSLDGSDEAGESSPKPRVMNYLKQSEVEQLVEEPIRDHTLVHGNLMYAIEPTKDDSLHESRLFMNALTLLNMREEMFMKILKDPSSSLANQMQSRQPNLRLGLNKSMSFSAPAPPPALSEVDSTSKADERSKGDQQLEREAHVPDSAPPASNVVGKKKEDRVGLTRFKNIREKIKFVIRDKKKEKNRIMMDALHHKVPRGTSAAKKLSEDIEHQGSDFGKSSAQTYTRTTSFDNSLHRYNQLLDKSSNKEAQDEHVSDESKLRIGDAKPVVPRKRAALGRILSSPEIRSYFRADSDETSDTVSGVLAKKPLHQPDKVVTPENENKEEVLLLADKPTADSKAEEEGSSHETSPSTKPQTDEAFLNNSEASTADDSKPQIPTKEDASNLPDNHTGESENQEMDSWFLEDMIDLDVEEKDLDLYESHVSEDAVGIVEESQIQQFYSDLMRVEVDDKNKAEFNYVKGVLELSGFSRNETLGDWQSADNPLDPSMFGEVEVEQQECYGNEEVICNQLMLFDLINEVLLQVHERSFCYWPTPLTNRSTIHPLPKGSRVLEEVWAEIRWLLRSMPESDEDDSDDAVTRDLAKNQGWMNLQLDAECVAIELEELIFDDLLQQLFAYH